MSADVVIPTYARGDLIDETLTAIRASTFSDFTLYVVDQSKDERTLRTVESHICQDSRIRYLHLVQHGTTLARNAGVAQGQAPYIVFADDDCVPEPEWLGEMVKELQDPETWAVFGRVIPETPEEAMSQGEDVSPAIKIAYKKEPERRVYQANRFNLGFGHGASMGFRREKLAELFGFDEMMGGGAVLPSWEERDIGYRILKRGGRIVYNPRAVIYHRHWRKWEGVRTTYMKYAQGTGSAVSKYVRCGDWAALYLLGEWVVDQGVRQMLSGLLKWHSRQKFEIGWLQVVYPWVGLWRSLKYPVDREKILYRKA